MRKELFIFILLCSLFIIQHNSGNCLAYLSAYPLYGKITDKETGKPLPYVNIRIAETQKGTLSNDLGYFYLLLEKGRYKIIFSHLGYKSDTLQVEIKDKEYKADIQLIPASILFPEITISVYHLNPAERIIKKAIENKEKYSSGLYRYEFESYQKTVMKAVRKHDTTGKDTTKKDVFADGPFKNKDTIIGGILEAQIIGRWEAPDNYQEEIIARQQSANIQPSNNIITTGKTLNLNQNIITIENNSVIGPTAPNALDYYTYEMIDTTSISGIPVFRIRLIPKTENYPLFKGTICIADSSFSVIDIDVSGNSSLTIPMVKGMRCRQQYYLFDNKFWLPVNIRVNYEVKFGVIPVPPIMVEQLAIIHNYKINESAEKREYDEYQIKVSTGADKIDSVHWAESRPIPLTESEIYSYHKIDSVFKNANLILKSLIALVRLMSEPMNLPITSLYDFYHYNRVEGGYFGLGLSSANYLKSTKIFTKLGYGFSSKKWRYGIGVDQALSGNFKTSIGMEVYDKLKSRENFSVYDPDLNTILALTGNFDYYDYYNAKGFNIFAKTKLTDNITGFLEYRNEEHISLERKIKFGPIGRKNEFRINPTIDDGKFNLALLTLNYDNRKFINTGLFDIPVSGENTWNLTLSLEYSNKSFFKNNFEYLCTELTLHRHQTTFNSFTMDLNCRLGFSTGILPYQRLFELSGSVAGLSSSGTFRTLETKEYQGDRFAAIFLEHNFSNYFFRNSGIPYLKDSGVDFIILANAGWMDIKSKSPVTAIINPLPTKNIHFEAGFSLGNLFPLLRADFVWKLSGHAGHDFTFTIGSAF